MEMFSKLGVMTPVSEGAGSHFAREQSLLIFVMRPITLVKLCKKFGQKSWLVVSQPLEALRRLAFSNAAATGIWCQASAFRVRCLDTL